MNAHVHTHYPSMNTLLFIMSIKSSYRSAEGNDGRLTPKLLNEVFSAQSTLYKSIKAVG